MLYWELGCSLLASLGVVCIRRAHVRKPSWEEAAEDRVGISLGITTVVLCACLKLGILRMRSSQVHSRLPEPS